jgi:glycosyltransferase involved in cell wall biosynthesis
MRILYFSKDYCPHDFRFLSALADSSHQVYYLRLERGTRQTEDRPVPERIEQIPWSGGQRPVRLSDGPRLLLELQRILNKIRPDVLHAGPIQTCGLLAALAGYHPLLIMSWGFDLMKDVERGPHWRWATKYSLARADWFTSDCEATLQKALAFGVPSGQTTVFPWGVDLDHFSPQPRQDGPGCSPGFTLFCNRSWEPNYGVDGLARAFVSVAKEREDVRLLLLGGGSQAGLLHQIFNSAGVQDRVDFAGHVRFADLPRFYRMADVYISPSHVDGSSVSLMEALASGLPCLVSDIPANQEWVSEGENGWLFPDGNDGALAARILQMMDARSRLNEMGLAARQVAQSRADWNKNFQILLCTYQDAISNWKSKKTSGNKQP